MGKTIKIEMGIVKKKRKTWTGKLTRKEAENWDEKTKAKIARVSNQIYNMWKIRKASTKKKIIKQQQYMVLKEQHQPQQCKRKHGLTNLNIRD